MPCPFKLCHLFLKISYIKLGDYMITLSLCMIVKNEHDTLGRCLDSAKDIADEIIIVDTGSTDDTKEIALKYTDKVYDFEWVYDFSKARNYSFSKATKDYIMWLDADDIILKEDLEKLKILKKILTYDIDMVFLKYNLNLDKNGIPALSYYRERIVKRSNNFKWISPIHEVIPSKGKILREDIAITHSKLHMTDPKRNITIFEKMIENGTPLDTRQTFYYARELMYAKRFSESISNFEKVLLNKDAWIENKISACFDLYKIYIELGNENMALQFLFKSFVYDKPRAEACCILGQYFISKKNYEIAIYWLNQALNNKYDISSGGFFSKDFYDFIPYIELCVCYFHLGNIPRAIKYNELAGSIKPNNESYLNNKAFFEKTKSKTNP